MLTIFDRYVVREILLPFFLGLLILTFILLMPPILENAQQLIAKGVDFPTVFRILLMLTPQALSVTIPMLRCVVGSSTGNTFSEGCLPGNLIM